MVFMIKTSVLLAGLMAIPTAAVDADERDIITWIDTVGGHCSRNEAGRMTSVDLRKIGRAHV